MTQAIEVSGLRKSYGRTVALDGLDLGVAAGEVHGFLGPNGAGKTTTIRILLGMLRSGGGTARLLGGDPWREAVALHRRLAYVPGDVTLWPGLTGGEIIDLLGRLRGGLDAGRRAALIGRFALDPAKKARTYSTGNRQKVALIAALASDAELLILDEPTAGLDPLMEAVFRDCVQDERERGRTVLLSSHILSEVEALCDRVTIIRAGVTVETGTLAQLRHLARTSITAELAARPDLGSLAGLHDVTAEPGPGPVTRLHCEVDAGHLDELLGRLVTAGVRSLVSRPPTLEELFLRHYAAASPAGGARA
jgi:ABC-2 type transport system ATP-binding protein